MAVLTYAKQVAAGSKFWQQQFSSISAGVIAWHTAGSLYSMRIFNVPTHSMQAWHTSFTSMHSTHIQGCFASTHSASLGHQHQQHCQAVHHWPSRGAQRPDTSKPNIAVMHGRQKRLFQQWYKALQHLQEPPA